MVSRLEFILSRSQDMKSKVSVLVSWPKKGLDNNTENADTLKGPYLMDFRVLYK